MKWAKASDEEKKFMMSHEIDNCYKEEGEQALEPF
jgi:hypothetical protein